MARGEAWRQWLHDHIVFGRAALAIVLLVGLLYFAVNARGSTPPIDPLSQTGSAAAPSIIDSFEVMPLKAKSAFVQDLRTGRVLYEHEADAQLPLASITKVPLAIAVSEVLSLDAAIKIPRDTTFQGNAERLGAGEVWRIKDILDYTLVSSSNGGAEILAEAADPVIRQWYANAPAKDATLWRMNKLSRDLGLRNTYYLNVTGLDESVTQAGAYGSARDVASLFAYAARTWPNVFAGTTKDGLLLTSVRGSTASAQNTDQALDSIPGLVMGKTGFTDLAGGNLAIVFEAGPARPMVAVVLGSTYDGRFEDMKKLVSATFASLAAHDI